MNNTAIQIKVECCEEHEVNHFAFNQMFDLWWSDFSEAGVEDCYVAFDEEGDVLGFQTINNDGLCIAIEVRPSYQGIGVASTLVEESGCWRPEQDENPDFWVAMQEKFGW